MAGQEHERVGSTGGGVVTLLFTDIVASTELLERLGDKGMDVALRRHFRALRDALNEHRGREVKNLGDGLLVAFPDVAAALSCAVEMQRSTLGDPDSIRMRVGIDTGDVIEQGGDYVGTTVVAAKRLCDAAQPREILTTWVVRELADEDGEVEFRAAGPFALKGLREAIDCFALAWEHAPAVRPQSEVAVLSPLPGVLARRDDEPFVGRRRQLFQLSRGLAEAARGAFSAALVSGEPGIGKTSLGAQIAREAHAAGTVALYGTCDPAAGPPFQPFAEALHDYVAAWPQERLRAQLGWRAGDLALLIPDAMSSERPSTTDHDAMQGAMFGAVAALLEQAARAVPVLLIIDDLHWADRGSLLLLRHLIVTARPAGLFVLGMYRTVDTPENDSLEELLASAAAATAAESLELDGLDPEETAALMAALGGADADEALAAAVYEGARGNPLLTSQLLADWVEQLHVVRDHVGLRLHPTKGPGGVPAAARDAIRQRLRRLPEAARVPLSTAAVVGPRFSLAVLERMSSVRDRPTMLDGLDEAVAARLVREVPDRPGRYAFAHELVRQTVLADLTVTRRTRLHREIAEALLAVHGEDDEFIDAVADHFAAAAADGVADQAVAYLLRAGRTALGRLAYDAAARTFRRALKVLAEEHVTDAGRWRCDATIGLGQAQRYAGQPAYRETLLSGARQATQLGDGERAARAALANGRGFFSVVAAVDDERIDALRNALTLIPDGDSGLRAECLARLAMELTYSGDREGVGLLSDEAVAIARRLEDDRALASVLLTRYITFWGVHGEAIRAEVAEEAHALAQRLGDRVLLFWSAYCRCHRSLELGDSPSARRLGGEALGLATALHQDSLRWFALILLGMEAMLTGPVERADELVMEAFQAGQAAGEPDVLGWFAPQIRAVRSLQGREDELDEIALQMSDALREVMPVGRWISDATRANRFAELGYEDEARAKLELLAADDFGRVPHDFAYLGVLAQCAFAAARLGDAGRAALVYERLEPFAGRVIDCGPAILGTTDLYLGVAAAPCGRDPDRHFGAAVAHLERLGARPWLVLARLEWARALVTFAGPRESERVRLLVEAAAAQAEEDGLPRLASSARSVGELVELHLS